MTTVFDEIKDKLRIEDVVGETVRLKKNSSNMTGFCPFHANSKTPALAVFVETQTWKCFTGCGGGDVFDWIEKRDGLDKRGALELLARKAGVELWTLTPEQMKAQEKRKEAAQVANVAAGFFQGEMRRGGDKEIGREYAKSRGWNDETLGGLGYFGKDWDKLKTYLADAGVDVECPAAVALVGFRGDVAAWGRKWGVQVTADEIADGRVHAMPPEMLMYLHVEGRGVVYVSGRRIPSSPALLPPSTAGEGGVVPKAWNPPERLWGKRQGYFNRCFNHGKPIVVVEGQGDAITLGQWGLSAVGLCGLSTDNALLSVLKKCEKVVVALDSDEAGQYDATGLVRYGKEPRPFEERVKRSLCWKLVEQGMAANQVRVLVWPEKDANDCLKVGLDAVWAEGKVKAAETFLDVMVEFAGNETNDAEERDEARLLVFDLLVGVDTRWVIGRKKDLAKALDYDSDTFDKLLLEARRRAGQDESGRPLYAMSGGCMVHNCFDRMGTAYEQRLLNGGLAIVGDLVKDDGEQQERMFTVEFTRQDGTRLHAADVDVAEFAAMGWLYKSWGVNAIMPAGASIKDHLRVATLTLSKNVQTIYRYQHTGWRNIGGKMVYLSPAGAVGLDGVQVEVPSALERYGLPCHPENVVEAARASFRFLETGEWYVTIPLLATMYAGPLASILNPAFSVWLFGTTETYKSGLTALAMCHFGKFTYRTPPASWISSSEVGLRVLAFTLKDCVAWIDDFTSQGTVKGNEDLVKKADSVLRDWGNRSAGVKGQASGGLRRSYKPRGVVINSAEILPPVKSIRSRLFMIEMKPDYVTLDAILERQKQDSPMYAHAMAGYCQWVAEHYKEFETWLPKRCEEIVASTREAKGNTREYNHVATLQTAFELALRWMTEIGAISADDQRATTDMAFNMMLAIGDEQHVDTHVDEDPVGMFMNAIEQMFADGTAFVRYAETPDDDMRAKPESKTRQVGAKFIGWYDEKYWYFLDSAYEAVYARFLRSGRPFPDTERGLKAKLREQKRLFPDGGDRFTYRFQRLDARPRVLRIARTDTEAIPSEVG